MPLGERLDGAVATIGTEYQKVGADDGPTPVVAVVREFGAKATTARQASM